MEEDLHDDWVTGAASTRTVVTRRHIGTSRHASPVGASSIGHVHGGGVTGGVRVLPRALVKRQFSKVVDVL